METMELGRTGLMVPKLGVGVMIWGDASQVKGFNPAKQAYGGTESADEEKKAFDISLQAGVNFFDTAEMYSRGASEKQLLKPRTSLGCWKGLFLG